MTSRAASTESRENFNSAAFMSSLVKGDPDEGSVLVNTAKEVLSSVLPVQR